jgi:hypothetical protein
MPTSLEADKVNEIKSMLDDTTSKIKAILNEAGLAEEGGRRKSRRSKKGRKTRRGAGYY